MAQPTVIINVVGLTASLIGEDSPHLRRFAQGGSLREMRPVLPAVTTTVQASMLTGRAPAGHGIVGNGWYNREYNEVHFWKQSNALVQGEKLWEAARHRDPSITCANMFWWYNMYSTVDWSLTPRPIYKADGRKIPDCYSEPPELRDEAQARLGRFPLFNFWGPGASIDSSRWIANASMMVHERFSPTLMLIYLPHLDYDLQRYGPDDPRIGNAVREIDAVVGELLGFFRGRGASIVVLSEYAIEAVNRPVAVNRVLRGAGLLRVREEEGLELLDPGASAAFAVADHQIAHVYVKARRHTGAEARREGGGDLSAARIAELLRQTPGVERVLDRAEQAAFGIDHPRSGDLVLIAEEGAWFTYHYWLDDARVPDFARTVDIHRKPGYDPLELFIDPAIRWPRPCIAWKLLRKALGFRMLMDVVPLDGSLVKGSHGRVDTPPGRRPVLITERPLSAGGSAEQPLPCTAVRDVILDHLFNSAPGQ